MFNNDIEFRRKKYFALSSQIAQLDNAQLRSLFDNSESKESNSGWGLNQTVVFGESKVFVKRVPVTNIEYNNLFSTKDFFVEMATNNMKNKETKLPHEKLRCLLEETGFLPSTEFV